MQCVSELKIGKDMEGIGHVVVEDTVSSTMYHHHKKRYFPLIDHKKGTIGEKEV
jgi:hypothetical protein